MHNLFCCNFLSSSSSLNCPVSSRCMWFFFSSVLYCTKWQKPESCCYVFFFSSVSSFNLFSVLVYACERIYTCVAAQKTLHCSTQNDVHRIDREVMCIWNVNSRKIKSLASKIFRLHTFHVSSSHFRCSMKCFSTQSWFFGSNRILFLHFLQILWLFIIYFGSLFDTFHIYVSKTVGEYLILPTSCSWRHLKIDGLKCVCRIMHVNMSNMTCHTHSYLFRINVCVAIHVKIECTTAKRFQFTSNSNWTDLFFLPSRTVFFFF